MRRFLSIVVAIVAVCGIILARTAPPALHRTEPARQQPQPQTPRSERKVVNTKSDLSGPVKPGDSVIFMVGNFAAQHNGTVITCDSAVRYSDMHIEFFGNVLINKNTTYIYGDRADYDGDINEARIYSSLIKVVDEDATLYTREFTFNTKDNIGRFGGGGVMTNRENVLEAVRGYYYADTKDLVAVERVEMRNDEYELTGDSVVYNMATDNAQYFTRTNIWSKQGDYLYADRGAYIKADTLYRVTRNGYILTAKEEMWSDSLDYYRSKEHVKLWRDIQIDDTEHKVLAFGDYGEYWKTPGDALLTLRPSMISYDTSEGSDSLFVRADSMRLFTLLRGLDTGALDTGAAAPITPDSLPGETDSLSTTPTGPRRGMPQGTPDSLSSAAMPPDSLPADSLPADSLSSANMPADSLIRNAADSIPLTAKQRKAQIKEAAAKAKAERKAEEAKAKNAKLDEIAARRREKNTERFKAEKQREEAHLEAWRERVERKMLQRQQRAERKGKKNKSARADSLALRELDSLLGVNRTQQDSLNLASADSLSADSLKSPAAMPDSLLAAPAADSTYRLVKGYRNVRMYRSDFQSVCDSMTAISLDSTIHLYISPVLWNEDNQITSEVMDVYTEKQQLVRAEFVGSPMMVGKLDTTHYNQVAGKEMKAYFRENQIYRNDVDGNAQTIYYMQDGEPPQITGMMVIQSGNMSFYIEDKQIVTITYRVKPEYDIYPIDKVPPTQELYLKGFKWEGERRPSQKDVFDRRVRPTQRESRLALPHPLFPIRESIDNERKLMVEQRRWSDRNDKVDARTVEWMNSLGFEVGKPRPNNQRPSTPQSNAPRPTTLP